MEPTMSFGTVQAEKMTTESGYSLGAGNASSFKNRIINGAQVIDQRNAGAAVTVNTAGAFYATDRFRLSGASSSGVFTGQQVSDAPEGFVNSLKITVTTTAASGDYYIVQPIEGYTIADLDFGKATAETVTLSFWVKSSLTGTFSGSLVNSDVNRSYAYTYSISSANTWEKKSVTIAGDTSGTWLTTNGTGIRTYFSLGSYSLIGASGSWASAFYIGATGETRLIATNGATLNITGVQLEVGTVATSFDYRPYGTELALCQRYLPYIGGISGNQSFGQCYANNTTTLRAVINFPVQARAYPTGLVTSTASGFVGQMQASSNLTASSLAITSIAGLTSALIELTVSGATAGQPGSIYNSGAGYMYFTGCEL
jgi:hypothetical protein